MPRHLSRVQGQSIAEVGVCSLLAHPVLFSYMVNAVLVETLRSPLHTSNAIIAAIVVPTDHNPMYEHRASWDPQHRAYH